MCLNHPADMKKIYATQNHTGTISHTSCCTANDWDCSDTCKTSRRHSILQSWASVWPIQSRDSVWPISSSEWNYHWKGQHKEQDLSRCHWYRWT